MLKLLKKMTWFEAFRGEFGYTYYGEKRTSVTVDISLAAVVYACILISIATIIAAAGIKGKERWFTLLRVIYGLVVASFILVAIYGYCWQIGHTKVTSPYIFRSTARFQGTTGVMIGLKQINITLTGDFEGSKDLNFNEEVLLKGVRGPVDELRHCLKRGLPDPVLSIVEYLSVDQGGMRWGRSFHMAGYFAYILLWTSFTFWLLANFLLSCVVFYGAALYSLTGMTMTLSSIVYHVLQPRHQLRMLCSEHGLELSYGWCFWSIFIFGILTKIIGGIVLFLENKYPKKMAKLFLSETQFEIEDNDDVRKFSTISGISNISSTTTTFHQNIKRRGSAPAMSYLNKGFNFDEINKENPVFEETEVEENQEETNNNNDKHGSTSGSEATTPTADTRSLSSTLSRGDTTKSKEQNVFMDKSSQATKDRLRNIYLDIEPTSSIGRNGH